jgi:hypothetical protein
MRSYSPAPNSSSWRTTPCRLFVTAYLVYSYLEVFSIHILRTRHAVVTRDALSNTNIRNLFTYDHFFHMATVWSSHTECSSGNYLQELITDFYNSLLINTCFYIDINIYKSRDSIVGIATGYGLDDRGVGVRVPVGQECSHLHVVQTGSGVQPTSYPKGTGPFPPEAKRPGRVADHSPPASADVKKMWIYTSIPPYTFMAWCLIS